MKNLLGRLSDGKCLMMVGSIVLTLGLVKTPILIYITTELDLIHLALCDPYDQSLWFYHQNLMCSFDPATAAQTMAPHLTNAERLDYIRQEIEIIQEMLDGAEDCKYIYQALIECTLLASKVEGAMSSADRQNVLSWLSELQGLDPLRKGRWLDLRRTLSGVSE